MTLKTEGNQHSNALLYSFAVIAVLLLATTGYLIYTHLKQTEQIEMLLQERNYFLQQSASTTKKLEAANADILNLNDMLKSIAEDLEDLEDDYRKERNKNEDFEDQIKSITGTVKNLDKLSKTDEELLQKYSRVYFLNENYVPSDLDKISDRYVLDGRSEQYFHGDALKFLEEMLDDAKDDNVDLFISSAYRSFDSQTELKGQYTQTYGSGANTFSADQGYSEHQLGTTADLSTTQINGPYASFADTEAFEWLENNAYKYGFVLSYPENNTFYVFEPWHWRFVGEELARDLHKDGAHFYDWDQRKIDTYLLTIFD